MKTSMKRTTETEPGVPIDDWLRERGGKGRDDVVMSTWHMPPGYATFLKVKTEECDAAIAQLHRIIGTFDGAADDGKRRALQTKLEELMTRRKALSEFPVAGSTMTVAADFEGKTYTFN